MEHRQVELTGGKPVLRILAAMICVQPASPWHPPAC